MKLSPLSWRRHFPLTTLWNQSVAPTFRRWLVPLETARGVDSRSRLHAPRLISALFGSGARDVPARDRPPLLSTPRGRETRGNAENGSWLFPRRINLKTAVGTPLHKLPL